MPNQAKSNVVDEMIFEKIAEIYAQNNVYVIYMLFFLSAR